MMPKHKFIQRSDLNITYHPLVLELCADDKIKVRQHNASELLDAQQVTLCIEQITLSVTIDPSDSNRYLLLEKKPLFFWLSQHPAARNAKVHLNIYSNDECESVILGLNLIFPAINHFFTASMLNNLYCRLKQQHNINTSVALTKRYLAKLAQVLPSAIRARSIKENHRG